VRNPIYNFLLAYVVILCISLFMNKVDGLVYISEADWSKRQVEVNGKKVQDINKIRKGDKVTFLSSEWNSKKWATVTKVAYVRHGLNTKSTAPQHVLTFLRQTFTNKGAGYILGGSFVLGLVIFVFGVSQRQ